MGGCWTGTEQGTADAHVRRSVHDRALVVAAHPHRATGKAQEIADRFKEGLPVIMNLENTDRDVSRRLIDFASGICYGLNGSMEKVASGVYLLKPLNRHE